VEYIVGRTSVAVGNELIDVESTSVLVLNIEGL